MIMEGGWHVFLSDMSHKIGYLVDTSTIIPYIITKEVKLLIISMLNALFKAFNLFKNLLYHNKSIC